MRPQKAELDGELTICYLTWDEELGKSVKNGPFVSFSTLGSVLEGFYENDQLCGTKTTIDIEGEKWIDKK